MSLFNQTLVSHENNPVLEVSESGSWDQMIFSLPIVLFENEKYYMWYVGANNFNIPPGKEQTGFAMSDEGITWNKDLSHSPVLKAGLDGEWDDNVAAALHIFKQDDIYKMLYGGIDLRTNYSVGLAMMELPVLVEKEYYSKPSQFQLFQNYPNPFNPTTTIRHSLPENSKVVLTIFNLLGEEIITLLDEFRSAGEKSVVWDVRDRSGQVVNSGIYIYSSLAKIS